MPDTRGVNTGIADWPRGKKGQQGGLDTSIVIIASKSQAKEGREGQISKPMDKEKEEEIGGFVIQKQVGAPSEWRL